MKNELNRSAHYNKTNKLLTDEVYDSLVFNDDMMDALFSGISQNIAIEMKKKNISKQDLANAANMNYTHLTNILKGSTHIGLNTLLRIAIVLNVSVSELVPIESVNSKTNGQRFDELTKELDAASSNFLIDFVASYCRDYHRRLMG